MMTPEQAVGVMAAGAVVGTAGWASVLFGGMAEWKPVWFWVGGGLVAFVGGGVAFATGAIEFVYSVPR